MLPSLGRPQGASSNPPSASLSALPGSTGFGNPGGLGLPPGLSGNSTQTPATATPSYGTATPGSASTPANPTQSPTTGSTPRAGLRDRRPRRSRSPTAQSIQGGFRASLTPTDVVPDVQPIQSGVPDAPVPAPRTVPTFARLATTSASFLLTNNAFGPIGSAANQIVLPVPVSRQALIQDPYAPTGVRVGNVYLFPVIGESIGYDTNPNRTQVGVRSSFVSQTEAEMRVQSDWSRHELSGYLRGAWDEYPNNTAANRPEGAGRLGLRLDATRDTQVDFEGHYQIDTERSGSPDLATAVVVRPNIYSEGGSSGVTQRFNRVIVSLRGTIDRTDYDNAKLPGGSILDQSDRNLTQYGGQARLGYELNPGLIPYIQFNGDTRVYDRRIDSSGYERSSDGISARLGTTFEITRLVTGDISAGVTDRTYQDRRLGDLLAPVADASLIYALTPITTVRANLQASVDETTVPGSNGVRSYRAGLEVSHDLRRNLTITAALTGLDNEYQGAGITERGFGALLRADYRLTRQIALRGSYSYEYLHSTFPGSSYDANVFLFGVRLQP